MKVVKKQFFTLLELLVVIFIMSLGAFLTGVKIKEMYQEQRFLSESQQILNYLSMAQDLMLIMNTDVEVKMAKTPDQSKIEVWLEIEKPINGAWGRLIQKKLALSEIHSFEFEGNGNTSKDLNLQFSFGRMPEGILTLLRKETKDSQHGSRNSFEIELLGYPAPIGSTKKNSKHKDIKVQKSHSFYPSEVYHEIYENKKEDTVS